MSIAIDKMDKSDWKQVSDIYLAGIKSGIATFQNDVPTWEEWDKDHINTCRLVARDGDKIVGWAALSKISSRCVYAGVAEVSIYIDEQYKGMGIGTLLLNKLINESEENDFWTLQAGIIRENIASRNLHKKCGFREIGFRECPGRMSNGKWHDVILVERRSRKVGLTQES